jgi:hypothetical protein
MGGVPARIAVAGQQSGEKTGAKQRCRTSNIT